MSTYNTADETLDACSLEFQSVCSEFDFVVPVVRPPPVIFANKANTIRVEKLGFLGKGMSPVYEVKDVASGSLWACKNISKMIAVGHARKRIRTEIATQQMVHLHPNIVRLRATFEDPETFYILFELCPSGALSTLMFRRTRFSEPEIRYWMIQLIGAVHHIHQHQVVHRDLKPANLFLDARMNLKVGDFGLADIISEPGHLLTCVAGTHNYLAPEILAKPPVGYDFRVDIWSIGVNFYTFLVGRPPFSRQDDLDLEKICRRTHNLDYQFPPDPVISSNAKQLVKRFLVVDPSQRPKLTEILDHPFFIEGLTPDSIPVSAKSAPPDFSNISPAQSAVNLRLVRKVAQIEGPTLVHVEQDLQTVISRL